jgi:hypothetical protein
VHPRDPRLSHWGRLGGDKAGRGHVRGDHGDRRGRYEFSIMSRVAKAYDHLGSMKKGLGTRPLMENALGPRRRPRSPRTSPRPACSPPRRRRRRRSLAALYGCVLRCFGSGSSQIRLGIEEARRVGGLRGPICSVLFCSVLFCFGPPSARPQLWRR